MAETQQSEIRFVRFGAFEADLRTEELRKHGRKLRFTGQPFQVLAILLERAGEVVTREELQSRIWPDTIVDVERNLNTIINKIREVLGDLHDKPRFVETLPRRGYRFIAAVDFSAQNAVQPLIEKQDSKAKDLPRMPYRLLLITGTVLVVVSATWYLVRPLPPPRITGRRQITHDGRPKQLIGTDGNRLYFNQDLGIISQVPVSGPESAQIPVPLEHVQGLADISPDGSNLLICTREKGWTGNGQLWVVRIFGGGIQRLPDGWWGAFSPDGGSVAYSTWQGEVWVVSSNGTGARKLASIGIPSLSRSLVWSPDGRKIRAFTWDGRLWEIAANGSAAQELQVRWPSFPFRCCGRWTPDGKFFLFLNGTSRGYFTQPEIWALDERRHFLRRSSDPIQLTSGPMEWGWPTPSLDGRTIYSDAGTSRGELTRVDVKSGQFEPFLGGISAQGVSFSPDGKSVAYVSLPEGTLWKANRDGSNPIQLSEPGMDACMPRWSPDSSQIVFYDLVDTGRPGHIYLVSTAGGVPHRLLPQDALRETDPRWSPDGQKILFASPANPWVLRTLDLKRNQVTIVPGSAGSRSPRWSPDGRYIAALSGNALSLNIFDTQTQRWSAIKANADFAYPEWSSDSHWIYFTRPVASPTTGPTGIFRVHPTGGEPEQVIDLRHFHAIGWFNTWFTLDPTGAPLIVKDVGTHDLYGLTLEAR